MFTKSFKSKAIVKSCALKFRSQTPSQPTQSHGFGLDPAKVNISLPNQPHTILFDIDPLDLKGLVHLYWLGLCLAPVDLEKTTDFLFFIEDKIGFWILDLADLSQFAPKRAPVGVIFQIFLNNIGTKGIPIGFHPRSRRVCAWSILL